MLRDKVEQKEQENKQKPAPQDIIPEFDVSEVFHRALQVVASVSLDEPTKANVGVFEGKTFCSNRAAEPSDGGQRKSFPVNSAQPVDTSTRVPLENYADGLQRLETLNISGYDHKLQDAYPVAEQ
ncbi:hypothetical protein N7523_010157 [Penicillium sp. IBT 18751x]|nr:hypothetical protein N7523_010157 [Penicillium sp. IBT 18751x]